MKKYRQKLSSKIRSWCDKFLSLDRYFWLALCICCFAVFATPILAQQNYVPTQTHQQISLDNLLTQGRMAYQAGRYAEATQIWQQAERTQKHHRDRALIFNYLALSSQKQGNWQQAKQYIEKSLALFPEPANLTGNSLNIYAQALNTRGRLELAMGQPETALTTWEQAATVYQQAKDDIGRIGTQINQAQALQTMGLYRRAQKLLQQISVELNQQTDPTLKIAGLRSLGNALQVTGDLDLARKVLQQSLTISQELNLPEESSITLFSLGNIAKALDKTDEAIAFYQQAATTTSQPLTKTETQLNQLHLLIAAKQWEQVKIAIPEISDNLSNLFAQPNRRSIYAGVNFAKNLMNLPQIEADRYRTRNNPEALLIQAIANAKELSDTKAESYALGTLGNLYEQQKQWAKSLEYTQQALLLSQNIDDNRLKYQWQWQLGRLLAIEGNRDSMIASYSEAVNSLESLRSDLIVTNIDNQFSFRESIEPVYRELVSLLLRSPNNGEISQENLLQARQTIESLQLAELNDYFREACLDTQPTDIDNIDRHAAVIYPIILQDRLEVILTLPGQPLRHYSTPIPQTELEDKIEQLRQTVTIRSRREFYEPARELYNWLITPALSDLEKSKIQTLVFVPDGVFRNIPMAVLYDGEHYLIEKYNLALTPGLQLLAPRPLEKTEFKTLAAGLTEAREGFAPLDYVRVEIEDIQNQLNSTVLLDGEFTQQALRTEIESAEYPVVHIATHGQFSSLLEDTFLLAWDGRIPMKQLDRIFQKQNLRQQEAIELLVLSACETAVGDERAALGLAGMAVKAGARSTVATLWSVNDRTTALAISNFYQQLTQPNKLMNKTQALRQTQMKLIKSTQFNHPFYWAPFILVGNWL